MSRALFILLIIYLILTFIGCLDEFTTLRGDQAVRPTSTSRAALVAPEPTADVERERRTAVADTVADRRPSS